MYSLCSTAFLLWRRLGVSPSTVATGLSFGCGGGLDRRATAQNAIRIMDAWSSTLKGGHTNANGQIQAGWTGAVFPRAAEIIRCGYGKRPDADIAWFQNMLTTQFLPSLIHGTWDLAYNEFHDRLGMSLPKMGAVLPGIRPTGVNHHMAWETLTHAGMGSIGLPPVKR